MVPELHLSEIPALILVVKSKIINNKEYFMKLPPSRQTNNIGVPISCKERRMNDSNFQNLTWKKSRRREPHLTLFVSHILLAKSHPFQNVRSV